MKSKQMSEYGDVLTPKEVKEILQIGENQVYKLLNSNELPNFRIGKLRRIAKISLAEYIGRMSNESSLDT